MSFLFGGQGPPPENPATKVSRDVRLAVRRLEREIAEAGRTEAGLLGKLRALGAQGKVDACQAQAKDLVRLRGHAKVLEQMRTHLTGLAQRLSVARSTGAIHGTLASTSKLLAALNKQLAPKEMQRVILEFQRNNAAFSDGQEVLTETLEDAFEGEEEGASIDDAVGRVFDEVGLDALRVGLPGVGAGPRGERLFRAGDDLAERLERLKCT